MSQAVIAIDDEEQNLLLIEAYLEGEGYDVKCFSAATEALDYLREGGSADAVLLDRMMPNMDGLGFMKHLKALPRYASVPVIMQTAAAVSSQIAEGIAAGAYYYLTKPYSREVLNALLSRALSDYSFHRQLEQTAAQTRAATSHIDCVSLSFQSPVEIRDISCFLASLYPDYSTALLGIREMMLNAVEHGNLAITYDEKTAFVRGHTWEQEVGRRLALPENRAKDARIMLERSPTALVLTVEDEGAGFDWSRYIEFDASRAGDPHGRGIMMSRIVSFDEVTYFAPGNKVVCIRQR